MSFWLSTAERRRLLGFNDRCALWFGIPLLSGVAFVLFNDGRGSNDPELIAKCYLISALHVVAYWISLRAVLIFLRQYLPERADMTKRMASYLVLAGLVILLISSTSRTLISQWLPELREIGWGQASYPFEFIVCFTLGVMVAAIYESIYFFTKYRESEVARERLAKEHARGQLAVLRQQMNPHFLFNSLNTLVNIIPEDAAKSTLFVQRLAAVYRRILEWRQRETISLAEELRAVQDYVFLLRTRYEEKLDVRWIVAGARVRSGGTGSEVRLPPGLGSARLVPLSVQLLVENAVKHNVVSAAAPLRIDIEISPDRITVRNPLNPRADGHLNSTGWGHRNLQVRYAAITDAPVGIREAEGEYHVTLPLLPAVAAQQLKPAV